MSSRTQTVTATSLPAYLNDHRGAAKVAIDMVTRLAREQDGTPLGDVLGRLAKEIDQDRATLADLMARLGIRPHPTKQAVGWVAEKLARVRFSPRLTGNVETSRLMQLESLSLGIEGKRLLWRSLVPLAGADPRLADVDLEHLQRRAEAQREWLEPYRLEAAAAGLG